MPSEKAADIIDLYQRKAQDWIERRARSGLFEKPWLDRFRALLPPAGPVLDLGCGSAEPMAAYLIGLGYSVVGVDSSPAMIDVCRRHFPEQEWIVADMRKLALQRRFSGILAWDSFFHLCYDDQRRMFPIFREHAAWRTPTAAATPSGWRSSFETSGAMRTVNGRPPTAFCDYDPVRKKADIGSIS
jgi:SAM-dependent methyltransferase